MFTYITVQVRLECQGVAIIRLFNCSPLIRAVLIPLLMSTRRYSAAAAAKDRSQEVHLQNIFCAPTPSASRLRRDCRPLSVATTYLRSSFDEWTVIILLSNKSVGLLATSVEMMLARCEWVHSSFSQFSVSMCSLVLLYCLATVAENVGERHSV